VPDCIVEHRPPGAISDLPNQLFINPDQCIDCGACEPECPWEAIFHEDHVPKEFAADIALNAVSAARPTEFVEATTRESRSPSSDEVEKNRQRWDATGDSPG
jgi:ferredoxin